MKIYQIRMTKMKSALFKNRMNRDIFVCDDIHLIETIDGVEYLIVHRPNEQRVFKMRKDALEKIKDTPVVQRRE